MNRRDLIKNGAAAAAAVALAPAAALPFMNETHIALAFLTGRQQVMMPWNLRKLFTVVGGPMNLDMAFYKIDPVNLTPTVESLLVQDGVHVFHCPDKDSAFRWMMATAPFSPGNWFCIDGDFWDEIFKKIAT